MTDTEPAELDPRSRSHPYFPTLAYRARMWAIDGMIDEHTAWTADDDDLGEALERAILGVLCERYGHEIEDDHCGKPEHRYCSWCNTRMSDHPLGRTSPGTSAEDL